jgi:6-phosphofructokinase
MHRITWVVTLHCHSHSLDAAAAGGICPGMNDIIQSLRKRLADYGVHEESVLGIR